MKSTQVARLLAYVSGLVNQQLFLQNEYLIADNRVLRSHLPARLRLTNSQRMTLAELAKRLGRKGLSQISPPSQNQKPFWPGIANSSHRSLMAPSTATTLVAPGPVEKMTELVLRMARENRSWGYDRIVRRFAECGL